MPRRRNPGQTVPIPWAPGFSVWRGTPTKHEIYEAPPFTVFVGRKVSGKIPRFAIDLLSGDTPIFIGERDDYTFDEDVAKVLTSSGLPWGLQSPPVGPDWGLFNFPDTDDEMIGQKIEIHPGHRFRLEPYDAAIWALEAGYTLLVVPDALKGKDAKYRMVFVIDDISSSGDGEFEQTRLHAKLAALAAAGPAAPSADLALINAHRRKIGMRPLDPAAAGWSDDDVRIEAERLRKNPRRRRNPVELPPGAHGPAEQPYEPLARHERRTGNYVMTIWEEVAGEGDDAVWSGIIVVDYVGPWGGGPPARLEYLLDEEKEADLFDAHREARGDFDVEQALLHFDYDTYCTPRRGNPRDQLLSW